MPIDLHWENRERNILHYRFVDVWNGVDLYTANSKAWEMINQVKHNVTLFLDFSTECLRAYHSRVPLLRMLLHSPPNLNHIVLIGNKNQIEFIQQVIQRVSTEHQNACQCAADLATAHQLLRPDAEAR